MSPLATLSSKREANHLLNLKAFSHPNAEGESRPYETPSRFIFIRA